MKNKTIIDIIDEILKGPDTTHYYWLKYLKHPGEIMVLFSKAGLEPEETVHIEQMTDRDILKRSGIKYTHTFFKFLGYRYYHTKENFIKYLSAWRKILVQELSMKGEYEGKKVNFKPLLGHERKNLAEKFSGATN